MPQPYPVIHPLNREEGIARYRALLLPQEYKARLAQGITEGLAPGPQTLAAILRALNCAARMVQPCLRLPPGRMLM